MLSRSSSHSIRIVASLVMLVASAALSAQTGWKLAWSDEFDGQAGSRPNPEEWKIVSGLGTDVGGNHEAETYCDYLSATAPCDPHVPNVYLDGHGHLVIVAVKTAQTVKTSQGDTPVYTSARVNSIRQFQYGRIEASLRVPSGQGIWPAFWAMGREDSKLRWPATGEIDIMESWNPSPGTKTVDPRVNHASIHGPMEPGSATAYVNLLKDYRFAEPMTQAWHQFAAEWSPGQIEFFCDGVSYGQMSVANMTGKQVWELDNAPFFLLLNLAMGGDFFGFPNDATPATPTLVADYVRVYQSDETTLPANWGNLDIGSPGKSGTAEFANGVWSVMGSGAGIAGRVDQFQFAYRAMAGDGEVSAHVLSQTGTNPQAKAGVMLRDGRNSGAVYAMLFVSPNGSVHFRSRGTVGDIPGEKLVNAPAAWFKLGRQGDIVTGLTSTDGKTWQQVGQAKLAMNRDLMAGLIATDRNNADVNLAKFDYVSVTNTDAAWDARAVHFPGTLQAEAFNTGGTGYTYAASMKHSGTSPIRNSEGPAIRQIATHPEPTVVPGGYALTNLRKDDYINYSVIVDKEDSYVLRARVASAGAGGSFHLNLDQKPITKSISIPDTGGADMWRTVDLGTVHLAPGQHTVAIVSDSSGAPSSSSSIDFITAAQP